MTSEQIKKLPVWAQSEFRVLEMRLDEANRELKRIKDNPKSNTIVGHGYDEGDTHYLKQDQTITFLLPNGRISVRVIEEGIDIHSNGETYKDRLAALPNVSNGMTITFVKK